MLNESDFARCVAYRCILEVLEKPSDDPDYGSDKDKLESIRGFVNRAEKKINSLNKK